jgi:RNA polymerase sigma factor (sigma-70 family)
MDDFAELVERLRNHDDSAWMELYQHYFPRLRGLVRTRLNLGLRRRVGSDEPVQSALRTFARRLDAREIDLDDSDALEALLIRITLAKTLNAISHNQRQRRDLRREQHDAPDRDSKGPVVEWAAQNRGPTAEQEAIFRDLFDRLCRTLSEEQRKILMLKLQGYTNPEIAKQFPKMSVPTVERRLREIRRHWQKDATE